VAGGAERIGVAGWALAARSDATHGRFGFGDHDAF